MTLLSMAISSFVASILTRLCSINSKLDHYIANGSFGHMDVHFRTYNSFLSLVLKPDL
jgi:hypothetical protein